MKCVARTASLCLSKARKEWDAGYELVDRYGALSGTEQLTRNTLSDLLNSGRLATLETWIDRRDRSKTGSPAVEVARGRVAFETGEAHRAHRQPRRLRSKWTARPPRTCFERRWWLGAQLTPAHAGGGSRVLSPCQRGPPSHSVRRAMRYGDNSCARRTSKSTTPTHLLRRP